MSVFDDLGADVQAFRETPDSVGLDLRMDLAELVARHLHGTGLTQAQFGAQFGKKAPYINRIISGTQNCTLDLVGQIIFAMGLRAKLSAGPADALPHVNIYFTKPAVKTGSTYASQKAKEFANTRGSVGYRSEPATGGVGRFSKDASESGQRQPPGSLAGRC